MKILHHIKLLGCFLLITLWIGCKKTNWRVTYKEKSKEPFGLYILHNEIEDLTGNTKIDLRKNFYDYLFDNDAELTSEIQTYLCIKTSFTKLKDEGVAELLEFVNNGNVAFLAFNSFPEKLEKELGFTSEDAGLFNDSIQFKNRKINITLKEKISKTYKYSGYIGDKTFYLDSHHKDYKNIIELGAYEDGQPNFIKINYGNGVFYLHNTPIVFSNYFLLEDREDYVEDALSYLPSGEILWDSQIRTSTYNKGKNRENSIFKFFLMHETLTWFLALLLIGLLLFMIFNARRKQRPIPIIKPLENSTVAFTQTIASLYLKEQDHKNLVNKKIKFFLEQVRTKYLLETNNLNAKFIENLALKSGNDLQKTKYLIHSIIAVHKKTECSEEELIVLYRMIENFFKK